MPVQQTEEGSRCVEQRRRRSTNDDDDDVFVSYVFFSSADQVVIGYQFDKFIELRVDAVAPAHAKYKHIHTAATKMPFFLSRIGG